MMPAWEAERAAAREDSPGRTSRALPPPGAA